MGERDSANVLGGSKNIMFGKSTLTSKPVIARSAIKSIAAGKMSPRRMVGALAGLALFAMTGTANATLIGDEVTATWTTDETGLLFITPTIQFAASPQTVGAGVEFSGTFGLEFGSNSMNIFLDVMSEGFSISFGVVTGFNSFGGRPYRIELGSLDWIGISGSIVGMSLQILGTPNVFGSVVSFGHGTDSAFVDLSGGSVDETLLFSFDVIHDVPEPGTLALFGLGLFGLAFARRWRRVSSWGS